MARSDTKNRRRRRPAKTESQQQGFEPPRGLLGGRYQPLDESDLPKIDTAVRKILSEIGMSDAPEIVVQTVCNGGGHMDKEERLHFSEKLIENALQGMRRDFTLCGQIPEYDLELGKNRVYVGSGGAAPMVRDMQSGIYRDSTLQDLYDAARLVDHLQHLHFFSRSLVARDMPDSKLLDINTAYACLAGTQKHVFVAATEASHVQQIAEMCCLVAGSREAFEERPFLSMNCNMPVPPMRFDPESCEITAECIRYGIPIHSNTFGQMGASSPVTMAGTIAQTIAETLSGMIFAWLINPEAKMVFGTRPMLTDLRTGAMSGGSPEGAVAMAASAQMGNYYGLVNSTIAGATDSKVPDAQSGYEKSLSVALAAQAGSNLITQAGGMQGSLMACALESYVIDNDMLGSIMKSLNPVEVNETTLALDSIDEVVHGDGHFLGRTETLERMQSDFVYPDIADRRSLEEWERDGANDIHSIALKRTGEILNEHFPSHIPTEIDKAIRSTLDIRLPESAMVKRG